MTNFTDRNTARKIANFIASDTPHNLGQGIPGWDCVDSPLHGSRAADVRVSDAPGRHDCYYVKTEMDGEPVQSTLADLEASLAGDENAAIDTKVLKVMVLPEDQQTDKCWRTFELLTLKDAIAEIKRTGRWSICGHIGLWPNGSRKARIYVDYVIFEETNSDCDAKARGYQTNAECYAETFEYTSAAKLADARAAESPDDSAIDEVVNEILGDVNRAKAVVDAAFPATPKCNRCGGKLTKLDIAGSLSELGFGLYEAICGTCYETHYC